MAYATIRCSLEKLTNRSRSISDCFCKDRLCIISRHLTSSLQSRRCAPFSYVDQSNLNTKANICVEPKVSLYDDKLNISVNGLPPNEKITFNGEVVQGKSKIIFASCGHYLTDNEGKVDLSKTESLGGTYTGVEQMGLIWSLKPAPGHPPHTRMAINFTDRPCIVSIKVFTGGFLQLEDIYPSINLKPVASVEIERWFKSADVTRLEVEEGKVRGALYLPLGEGPFRGVIDMFGSNGGIMEYRSALLASRGFATLSLPYFKYKDLPDDFYSLDLEYFQEAIDWLSKHPKISNKGVGIIAVSKGAEIAHSMDAYCEKVKAVVIINSLPHFGFGGISFKGKVLHKSANPDLSKAVKTSEGFDITAIYDDSQDLIPIWKGEAKHLWFVSEDDYQLSSEVHKLLYNACPTVKKAKIEIVRYPGAGHLLEPPYNPLCRTCINRGSGLLMKWGGHPKEHAHAQEDSWQRILTFFKQNIPCQ